MRTTNRTIVKSRIHIGQQLDIIVIELQLSRMDTLLYVLVYPQGPLLTTRTIELVGYDKLEAGQNATVAVMSYSGYDIEDAIVMNKASLDRGFGRCIVMKRLSAIIQKYENNTQDRIARPNRAVNDAGRMQYVFSYCFIIDFKFAPQTFKGPIGESSVVDKVALFTDKNHNMCIKYLIRHTRRPEVVDKFSSKHGQKGVCGTIVQQEDFPFLSEIRPRVLLPNRMTVGKMIELLGGKAGEPSGHAYRQTLVEKGFSYNGKDFIYSGFSILLPAVITYHRLPTTGIYFHGTNLLPEAKAYGLRVGEMERDCLIAHGASMLIFERLMISSDPFEVQVCRACGLLGYYNHKLKTGICSSCKNGDNISTMKLPYACKLLIQVREWQRLGSNCNYLPFVYQNLGKVDTALKVVMSYTILGKVDTALKVVMSYTILRDYVDEVITG
ncbi:hypothetical protein FEM48_ZijujUnG0008700 [Ziziphus jujuba var. spinosa]|uniref:DNA-directed RNA polymerase n=1 Tax=Ziziphus jujuba var. spinosa TaxID=714518 RepID=A0A978U9Z6_ZIZJJ|nr:hypothetical protein FEM48_ZijujUnG0008700 [Ziziphus jujuba var. spinosa]